MGFDFSDPDKLLKNLVGGAVEWFKSLPADAKKELIESFQRQDRWWELLQQDPNRPSEVCVCECHSGGLLHIVACCDRCSECGLPIRRGAMESHSSKCGVYTGPILKRGD